MIKNLSPSRASQFKTCPKQFKFANIDKLKEPTNEVQAKEQPSIKLSKTYLTYLKKTGILKNSIIYFVKHGRKLEEQMNIIIFSLLSKKRENGVLMV